MSAQQRVKGHSETTERPTIDEFITLFIAALVMRGKRYIYVRGSHSNEERDRMYALSKYLDERCDQKEKNKDRSRLLLRLRSELAPGLIGAFDGFKHQIRSRMMTIVSIELPFCDHYKLDLQPVTARCYLEQADTYMRELAEGAATAYLKAG